VRRKVPIMDGSAGPFVFLIQSRCIEEQDCSQNSLFAQNDEVTVEEDGKKASFLPFEGFQSGPLPSISKHPVFRAAASLPKCGFLKHPPSSKEVSRGARTFGSCATLTSAAHRNLALGVSVDNAIVWTSKPCN